MLNRGTRVRVSFDAEAGPQRDGDSWFLAEPVLLASRHTPDHAVSHGVHHHMAPANLPVSGSS
jgi:hypothetical protein